MNKQCDWIMDFMDQI